VVPPKLRTKRYFRRSYQVEINESLRNFVEDNEVKLCKKNQVAGFASYTGEQRSSVLVEGSHCKQFER
jgi:hypothetical protein